MLSSNVLSNVSLNRFKQMVMILARLHLVLLIEESNFLGSPFLGGKDSIATHGFLHFLC